jgi:GNAT superfamily N-acetyltransferase
VIVRSLEQRDLDEVIALCAEHAAFERASYDPVGKREKLAKLFFGSEPALVGKVATDGQSLFGYATASVEVSTWAAERFMHLDCLFVREGHRGSGIGARLMDAIVQEAARLQINQVQWQTPKWNIPADRFYRRLGALACEKFRYTLAVNS